MRLDIINIDKLAYIKLLEIIKQLFSYTESMICTKLTYR